MNENTKHTPGPWSNGYAGGITGPTTPVPAGPFCDKGRDYTVVSKDKMTICAIPLPESGSAEELEANALLIASAPETAAELARAKDGLKLLEAGRMSLALQRDEAIKERDKLREVNRGLVEALTAAKAALNPKLGPLTAHDRFVAHDQVKAALAASKD